MEKNLSVVVKSCKTYDYNVVYEKIVDGLSHLGGIDKFITAGDKVLIKPNLLIGKAPDKAVTTHPSLIESFTQICCDIGAKVTIGDSPAIGSGKSAARKSGYEYLKEKYGVEIVDFNDPVDELYDKGKVFKKFTVDRRIVESDKIINIAKLKTHGQMNMTLSVKNMFGSIVGTRKTQWHLRAGVDYDKFATMLLELYSFTNTTLDVIDGIIGMEGNGPNAGTPKQIGVIIMGTNGIAVDRVACKIVNVDPKYVPIFPVSQKLEFDGSDISEIQILGDDINPLIIKDFKQIKQVLPETSSAVPKFMVGFLKNSTTTKPFINRSKCTVCKQCVNICPAKVMSVVKNDNTGNGYVEIDHRKCIRCYCCQEICPEGAISLKKGWLSKIIGW